MAFEDGMGETPVHVTVQGKLDGHFPVKMAGVHIRQFQPNAVYACAQPFAFVRLGPSNLAPRRLEKGEAIREKYLVTVFDLSDAWMQRPL